MHPAAQNQSRNVSESSGVLLAVTRRQSPTNIDETTGKHRTLLNRFFFILCWAVCRACKTKSERERERAFDEVGEKEGLQR